MFIKIAFRGVSPPSYGWGLMSEQPVINTHRKEPEMAYLEITLKVDGDRRTAAADVYQQFRAPFLDSVPGARSKELLIRDEDVQVLHQFTSVADANAYLETDMFARDIVGALSPLLSAQPEIRIYEAA